MFAFICLLSLVLYAGQARAAVSSGNVTLADSLTAVELGSIDGKISDVWGWQNPVNGKEYAIVGMREYGTSIVDISDPSNLMPPLPDQIIEGQDAYDVKVYGHFLYVANRNQGPVQIWNIEIPEHPQPAGTIPLTSIGGAHNLFIDEEEGTLFIAPGWESNEGGGDHWRVYIYDLSSNPAQPPYITEWNLNATYGSFPHDLYIRGNRAYIAHVRAGLMVVEFDAMYQIQNVWQAEYSRNRGDCATLNEKTHSVWVSDDGQYAFTTDELGDYTNLDPAAILRIWDISDLNAISMVGFYDVPEEAQSGIIGSSCEEIPLVSGALNNSIHNVYLKDKFAYISYYTKGLRLLDIVDPAQAVEVGYYDTPGKAADQDPNQPESFGSWGVYPYLPSGNILLSDKDGLRVFKHSFEKSGTISGAEIWSNYIHLAGDVTVSGNLTIDPGTLIRVEPGTQLLVDGGSISINGTSNNPVVFEPRAQTPARGFWDGISFANGHRADIYNAIVRYAKDGISLIKTENSEGVTLSSVTVEECYNGLVMEEARHVTVNNSVFQDNEDFGVWLTNSIGSFADNTIRDNGTAGVYCYQESSPMFSDNVISNNGIPARDARWSGVYATVSSHPTFYGITQQEADNCEANNWIHSNGASGVIADESSFPVLGVYDSANPYPTGGFNRIYGNRNDVANYNQNGAPIYAQVNYWGFDPRDLCARFTPSTNVGKVIWDPVAPLLSIQPMSLTTLQQGLVNEQAGNYDAAVTNYDAAIAAAPDSPRVNIALGGIVRSFTAMNRSNQIIPHLRQIWNAYPQTRASRYALDHVLPQLITNDAYSQGLTLVDTLLNVFENTPRTPVYLYERSRIRDYQNGSTGGLGKRGNSISTSTLDVQSIVQSYPDSPVALMIEAKHLDSAPEPSPNPSTEKEFTVSNFPNPFNPTTQIRYVVMKPAQVTIQVFDVTGRRIKSLVNTTQPQGKYNVTWDATDTFGNQVSTGMYFYRAQVGSDMVTGKLLYLK